MLTVMIATCSPPTQGLCKVRFLPDFVNCVSELLQSFMDLANGNVVVVFFSL